MRGDEHASYDGAARRRGCGRRGADAPHVRRGSRRRRGPPTSTRCCAAVGTSCCWSPRPCWRCRCRRSRSASWPGSSGCSSWSGRACRASSGGPLRRRGGRCRCWPWRAWRSGRPSAACPGRGGHVPADGLAGGLTEPRSLAGVDAGRPGRPVTGRGDRPRGAADRARWRPGTVRRGPDEAGVRRPGTDADRRWRGRPRRSPPSSATRWSP